MKHAALLASLRGACNGISAGGTFDGKNCVMKKPIDRHKAAIGGRIAKAREQKCLSQLALAAKVGVSHSAVGQWERGYTMPDMHTLGDHPSVFDRVATELGVTREYLLTGNKRKEKEKAHTDVELEYLKIVRLMSGTQRRKFLRDMYAELGIGPASNLVGFDAQEEPEAPPTIRTEARPRARKIPKPDPRSAASTRRLRVAC